MDTPKKLDKWTETRQESETRKALKSVGRPTNTKSKKPPKRSTMRKVFRVPRLIDGEWK